MLIQSPSIHVILLIQFLWLIHSPGFHEKLHCGGLEPGVASAALLPTHSLFNIAAPGPWYLIIFSFPLPRERIEMPGLHLKLTGQGRIPLWSSPTIGYTGIKIELETEEVHPSGGDSPLGNPLSSPVQSENQNTNDLHISRCCFFKYSLFVT